MKVAVSIALTALVLLAARGETPAAFDGRCILAGCVAPRSNTPGILGRRALPSRRLARLGATPDFHHGLLGQQPKQVVVINAVPDSAGESLTITGENFGFVPFVTLNLVPL